MGAWIETKTGIVLLKLIWVASFMGAWIETPYADKRSCKRLLSHPLWVRGLKPYMAEEGVKGIQSHPLWVRGLKRRPRRKPEELRAVASFMGAWIETLCDVGMSCFAEVASFMGAWIETLCW